MGSTARISTPETPRLLMWQIYVRVEEVFISRDNGFDDRTCDCSLAESGRCIVLKCVSVAVRCSVLQRVAVFCSVLQCVAVCCSVLQCIAVCCSMLRCDLVCYSMLPCFPMQCVLCCIVLHCVALFCSVYGELWRHSKESCSDTVSAKSSGTDSGATVDLVSTPLYPRSKKAQLYLSLLLFNRQPQAPSTICILSCAAVCVAVRWQCVDFHSDEITAHMQSAFEHICRK